MGTGHIFSCDAIGRPVPQKALSVPRATFHEIEYEGRFHTHLLLHYEVTELDWLLLAPKLRLVSNGLIDAYIGSLLVWAAAFD